MTWFHSTRLALPPLLCLLAVDAPGIEARQQSDTTAHAFIVFLQSRPIGREEAAVVRQADGWIIRGSGRLAAPLDVVTRSAEIRYTTEWHASRFTLEGSTRGQELSITTTFGEGKATSQITSGGTSSTKVDDVAADTIVLPNTFLSSYEALSHRLVGARTGATIRAYIVPQAEVAIRVDGVFPEHIETPQRAINATRYALIVTQPGGETPVSMWADPSGGLLRISVPVQGLEVAREDIASAASRTTSFSLPTDQPVRVPANGFNLAGSLAKPASAAGRQPALLLVGGSGPTDRDATAFGVPVMGQMAAALVDAGFLVLRYDKRGVGQSGGRAESATIGDYVEDARAAIAWLEDREDVDKRRIGIVGHSEGAWVALAAAARDKRIAAVAIIAGPSAPGTDVVLEQQAHLFDTMKTPEADRQQKIAMQKQINAAVLGKGTWEGIPDTVRKTADTPWFHSYLSFDPIKQLKDTRQPLLIVQGELDTQVLPHHADKLADVARTRKSKAPVELLKVPGVNHLLLPAKTGELDEYATLEDRRVSSAVTSAVALWMAKTLGPAR